MVVSRETSGRPSGPKYILLHQRQSVIENNQQITQPYHGLHPWTHSSTVMYLDPTVHVSVKVSEVFIR